MHIRDLAVTGQDDDYSQAHRLFLAAYAMIDNGRPTEVGLELLRAASAAWERHLAVKQSETDVPAMSDSLRDWCSDPAPKNR